MMGTAMPDLGRVLGRLLAILCCLGAMPAAAQPLDEGLIVVYGAQAPTREGDVDRHEQIFFSIPADTPGRVFVRLFDP